MEKIDRERVYGLYDLDEVLVKEGSLKEMVEFTGRKLMSLRGAIYKNSTICNKYKLYDLGYFDIEEKRCPTCGRILPLSEFGERKATIDGVECITHKRNCHECELKLKSQEYHRRMERRRKGDYSRVRTIYGYYRKKDNKLICKGTAEEVAKKLGIEKMSVYKMCYDDYKRGYKMVKLGKE